LSDLSAPRPLDDAPTWVQSLPSCVSAGFPSPAEDHAVNRVDLMAQLIKHPAATYLLRVRGESMRDAGIFDNDVVLVDRAITPRSGHVVVAVKAANVTFADICPKDGQEIEVWGVVVASIKQFQV
jgi:DNA polymerase V